MVIIRERISKNGILDQQIFQDVVQCKKRDNHSTRWGPKSVLQIVYEGDRKFPIIFPNAQLRDSAEAKITSSTSSAVVLDLNEFFTWQLLKDSEAEPYIKGMYLTRHLKECLVKIIARESVSLDKIKVRDAFNTFTVNEIQHILDEEPVGIKESQLQPTIWSKTLYVPKRITDMGITPLQFYKQIIKNEKNIICSTPAFVDSV